MHRWPAVLVLCAAAGLTRPVQATPVCNADKLAVLRSSRNPATARC